MWKLSGKSSDYYKSQDKILNPVAERSEQMSHILYVLWANCHLLAASAFSKLIKHHVTDWLKLREIHTAKYYVCMKIKCCLVWKHKAFLSCLQGDWSRGQELNAEEIVCSQPNIMKGEKKKKKKKTSTRTWKNILNMQAGWLKYSGTTQIIFSFMTKLWAD